MAGIIKIKKRDFPIEVSTELAQQIKNRKYGLNGARQADPGDLVDFGDKWAGTYADIHQIEIIREPKKVVKTDEELAAEYDREMLAMPIEERAKILGFSLRNNFYISTDPRRDMTEEEKVQAISLQLDYFRANPNAPQVPKPVAIAMVRKILGYNYRMPKHIAEGMKAEKILDDDSTDEDKQLTN